MVSSESQKWYWLPSDVGQGSDFNTDTLDSIKSVFLLLANFGRNLICLILHEITHQHITGVIYYICRAALDRAAVLLKMSMGGLRIDNHWGTGGGQRPVIQLIKEVITF